MRRHAVPLLWRLLLVAGAAIAALAIASGQAAPARAAGIGAVVKGDTLFVSDGDESSHIIVGIVGGILQVDGDADGTPEHSFDPALFTRVVVRGGGGDDTIQVFPAIPGKEVTVEGGRGDDVLLGGNGAEVLSGGDGADVLDGNQGPDVVWGGAGADTLVWDPGDGSDVVDGGGGRDTLDFNGSSASEIYEVSANGDRVRFTRNVANVVMDLGNVEAIDLDSFGGADQAIIGDVTGTDLSDVIVDLALNTGDPDTVADEVIVHGTPSDDALVVSDTVGGVVVTGGGAAVEVVGADADVDEVTVDGRAGTDTVTARLGASGPRAINAVGSDGDRAVFEGTSGADEISVFSNGPEMVVYEASTALLVPWTPSLLIDAGHGNDRVGMAGNIAGFPVTITVEGGRGDDVLLGGNGAEVLSGGDGADVLDGNQGPDVVWGGAGADTLVWDPGDGSDVVDGGGGRDTLDFNGSSASEIYEVSANGDRVRFTRNVANVVMDLGNVEAIDLDSFGGADQAIIGDVTGTDLSDVIVDLALNTGDPDTVADEVIVHGTPSDDTARIVDSGDTAVVKGLPARVFVSGADAALDRLELRTQAGFDVVKVADAVKALIQVVVDLGAQ